MGIVLGFTGSFAQTANRPPIVELSAQDVRTFATMIANEFDVAHSEGMGDFSESESADNVQTYTWGTRVEGLWRHGFAPTILFAEASYYVYLVCLDS